MKKLLAVLTTLAVLTSLTACGDKTKQGGGQASPDQGMNQNADNSSDTGTENSSDTSSDAPKPENSDADNSHVPLTGKDLVAAFVTPDGKPVDLTGVPLTDFGGNSITVDELTENNWMEIRINDSVYLAESSGIWYDSVTNADIFNADTMEFTGAPEALKRDYKIYKVGDTFGELKISKAATSFMNENSFLPRKYFNGGEVWFDGTLTLTGKIYMSPETEGYVTEHDLFFELSSNDIKKIPIMNYPYSEDGTEPLYSFIDNGTVYLTDSTRLSLGNADNYPEFDFSGLPTDGTEVDAKITIDSIFIRNYINFTRNSTARLLDIEIL
ncbi:MAG: hypothetical protein K2N56_03220 [Oscillospiraceae bacterium]|nr:hypothetical protein [Oscillospiraceae bacterium]